MVKLSSVPDALIAPEDDGTHTVIVRYAGTDPNEVRAQANADSLKIAAELFFEYVRIDPPDVCGMGDHVLMTQRYRRTVSTTDFIGDIARRAEHAHAKLGEASTALEAAGAAVEALTTTPVDPDPAA